MSIETLHPDIGVGARIIRSRGIEEAPLAPSAETTDFTPFRWATNMETSVLEIIRPIVLGENVTIVTGYASLLSVLSLVVSLRPGITFADRGTVRIVLGEEDRPAGRSPYPAPLTPARLRAIFLHPAGVAMSDPRDVRAATSRAALAKGSIRVRIVDATQLGPGMSGLQANLIVGEDFAVLSSGGFSRRDLLERAVMADRVANDTEAFVARQETAETLWNAGQNCTTEVGEIMDALFAPVEPRDAARRAVRTARSFPLFETEPGQSPIHAELVGQALARTYENGFAFVRVPAGAGQAEISDLLDRRLAFNAERMLGRTGMDPRQVHVETATGARWSDDRIAEVLARKAPLVLDGSVAPKDGETELAALYRRLKCRHRPGATAAAGVSDFDGFPQIQVEILETDPTKAQALARSAAVEEIQRAHEGALDDVSAANLESLSGLVDQFGEAALLAWRQGGMSARVRTSARAAGADAEANQSLLPMFEDDAIEPEPHDGIGEALSSRGLKGLDKARLGRIAELGEPTLILAESGLVRHAIARRLSSMVDAPVLGIVGEDILRAAGISGRETPYQRADTSDVAMSILSGAEEGGPRLLVASAAQAAEMTLPRFTSCLVVSAPPEVSDLAAALSSIDGLGKASDHIRVAAFAPIDPPFGISDDTASDLPEAVRAAVREMRTSSEDTRDGVADILAGLDARLQSEAGARDIPVGRVALATIESRTMFSLFALAGVSSQADSAAHPPRILVVRRNPHTGEEEILRNQVGCADFLAGLDLPLPEKDPRIAPELPEMDTLETIGRHMSHLSHWDARPERMVAALEALAVFLRGKGSSGEELFSDLRLTSLEILFDRWQKHLRESRELASIAEPGLGAALAALEERPLWEIDEIRADLESCLDQRIAADARRPRALHDRVVAVIHGTGEADLTP